MTTITITANDSSSAMDQIVQKLGPEALIISTKNRGGKVEIKATNEAITDLRKPTVEAETGDFSDLIRRRMPRIGNSGRRAVQKFGKRRAINADSVEKISIRMLENISSSTKVEDPNLATDSDKVPKMLISGVSTISNRNDKLPDILLLSVSTMANGRDKLPYIFYPMSPQRSTL